MKKLGINIDGVIRDYLSSFDKQYRKAFIFNPSIVAMDEKFQYKEPTEEELEEKTKKIEEDTKKMISLPVDTLDLLNHYEFNETKKFENSSEADKLTKQDIEIVDKILTPQESLEDFMYNKYPFQIFGDAEEFQNAMSYFNRIQGFGIRTGLFETVLISNVKGQAVTANYYFLHKTGSRAKNIVVVNDAVDKWEVCDVLVDVDPEVLQNKPNNKISIKINRLYNQWDEADYSLKDLKELNNDILLKKIF